MSGVHQQTDCVHRDASAANELEASDLVLAACCAESLGRPVPLERRLCVHLSVLRDGRDQQARVEVP